MTSIIKLISEIQNPSFLSHCKIVPGIQQLIELTNVLIVENPDEYFEYHMIIADFLVLLMEKIDKEPYLIDLFSNKFKIKNKSRSASGTGDDSENTFLPLKIALYLLKQTNPLDR